MSKTKCNKQYGPLTNEQIWGVSENQMPQPEKKDYFDITDETDEKEQNTEAGSEDGSSRQGSL
jgi:hypothetical protein